MCAISEYIRFGILFGILVPLWSWNHSGMQPTQSQSPNLNMDLKLEILGLINPLLYSNSNLDSRYTVSSASDVYLNSKDLQEETEADSETVQICQYEWSVVQYAYTLADSIWCPLQVVIILGVNGVVLWVIKQSRGLWNSRHLFMVCLCTTNLLTGFHKIVELIIVLWPRWELCVIHRATLGIPIVANMILLTLISIDRFVAVKFPFFYLAYMSGTNNNYIFYGLFGIVALGITLATSFITLGFLHPLIDINLWIMYFPLLTAVCTVLILVFNTAVLRIARQQMAAMSTFKGNDIHPKNKNVPLSSRVDEAVKWKLKISLPSPIRRLGHEGHHGHGSENHLVSEAEFTEGMTASPSTPSFSVSAIFPSKGAVSKGGSIIPSNTVIGIEHYHHKHQPCCNSGRMRWNWRLSHLFQVRLSRSIRLARTFLMMSAPMLLVIFPIAVLIPLRRTCDHDSGSEHHYKVLEETIKNCSPIVNSLWSYLLLHVRSILPIQAVTDTLVYALTCKEFHYSFRRVMDRNSWFHY